MRLLVYDPIKDIQENAPTPFSIIFDHGMTAITWDDGSVTRTHCQEGDAFDPLFGVMACTLRKLTNNHGHVIDECEDCIREIAKSISEPADIGKLLDFTLLMADMLDVLIESEGLWKQQLGKPDGPVDPRPKKREKHDNISKGTPKGFMFSESSIKEQERIRQMVRDLIDKGEL